MPYRPMPSKRGGSWTKVVIFISLYVMLFQSLIEWVVVLYLYANKHVDSKMSPSLILALIASLFTVPLVVLHSLLGWHYNKIIGYESQKTMLHTVCTYILRLTVLIWLGASVAGLVVVSQQAFCLPETAAGGFWKTGISCALHRAVVIVSILSFLTVCLYFCSRELCERPYDISLLGIYNQRPSREGSIVSASTLNSEKKLKRDLLCCQHPDITNGRTPYVTSSDNSDVSHFAPSIRQPSPVQPTSFLHFGADPVTEAEYLSGTTATPGTQRDQYFPNISRTPSVATTHITHQAPGQILPELPAGPSMQWEAAHQRDKSSTSSLRRFLPKSIPASQPLSADPQIRALAEERAHADLEKQEAPQEPTVEEQSPSEPLTQSPLPSPKDCRPAPPSQSTQAVPIPSLPRSTTTNSADAPEVVTPGPLKIRRSSTTAATSLSHHTNPATNSWAALLDPAQPRPMRMSTMRIPRRQSQFDPVYTPRYTQSQRFPGGRNRSSRHLRRNDVEFWQHQGPRRPRSSTFGNIRIVSPGHLDCIRESGTSLDELPPSADRGVGSSRG
ncbi:hypothetical protein BJX63DRAFT_434480 [Aspergillus granulosus]|uniref:Uncharacterized protein n=1 Tax=Aspergillus granulosus TaxID=176169 RepID=A0ABR4H446_9EURO